MHVAEMSFSGSLSSIPIQVSWSSRISPFRHSIPARNNTVAVFDNIFQFEVSTDFSFVFGQSRCHKPSLEPSSQLKQVRTKFSKRLYFPESHTVHVKLFESAPSRMGHPTISNSSSWYANTSSELSVDRSNV